MKDKRKLTAMVSTFLARFTFFWAALIVFFPVVSPPLMRTAVAQGFLDAASLDIIRSALLPAGITGWPQYSADPVTCNAAAAGGYYFNTGTSQFRTCDGSTWTDREGASTIGALSDVTITSVADNNILQYNSGSGDWENVAPGAVAMNDLTDVSAPTPSDGDILVYDGVTDNRWESIAGASPTTLSGLSDTAVSGPAAGDHLIYNGSAWANIGAKSDFIGFPIRYSVSTVTSNAIINANNQVKVYRLIVPDRILVNRTVFRQQNACTSGSLAVGVYTQDGNTLIGGTGAVASAASTIHNIDHADFTLNPGEYWLAYTATSTSCTVSSYAGDANWDGVFNGGATFVGTAANASVAGALPSTLGTITANTNIHRIVVKLDSR